MNTLSSILKFIEGVIAPIATDQTTNKVLASPNGSTGKAVFRAIAKADLPSVLLPKVGVVEMYAGLAAPSGWLFCKGQAVSRTTYAELFSIIGTNYGVGDGSTTFNLPDLQDRVPVGAGSAYAVNAKGGNNTRAYTPGGTVGGHTLTANQSGNQYDSFYTGAMTSNATHSHYAASVTTNTANGSARNSAYGWDSSAGTTRLGTSTASVDHLHPVSIPAKNAAEAHNHSFSGTAANIDIRQPYIGLNFIIYTGVA